MTIHENLEEFAGLPVHDFDEPDGGTPEPEAVAWRVREGGHDTWRDAFLAFLDSVATDRVEALVVGWFMARADGEDYPGNVLAEFADRLPALRSLFVGDMTMEESEISWIVHEDATPLIKAFPRLERLEFRGHLELRFEPFASESLRTLRFESGGLPSGIVKAVAASDLPNLEHLAFWLGDEGYGGDVAMDDLTPFLTGERLPALRHLGLENSDFQDEIAAALAGAPVVARLESLGLAMGVLTDTGAEALLSGQPLTHLKSLDLHYNFLSDEMARQMRASLPGVQINLDERRDPEDDGFYIAVSE
ncbi:STM4015 family protein [Actinomadura oligospora]|uniref:STM4015 family protein n=1 Tax=Actinomadura oligospora TaxID=111804 RepID=UPI00047A71BE|nr:STM4015 family protein [Actinomadura oligospora]